MLLYLALSTHNIKVVPYLNLQIPIKKKGPPYQTDYIVASPGPKPTPTDLNDENTSKDFFSVLKGGKLLMIIEVKKTVNSNICYVETHDAINILPLPHEAI